MAVVVVVVVLPRRVFEEGPAAARVPPGRGSCLRPVSVVLLCGPLDYVSVLEEVYDFLWT